MDKNKYISFLLQSSYYEYFNLIYKSMYMRSTYPNKDFPTLLSLDIANEAYIYYSNKCPRLFSLAYRANCNKAKRARRLYGRVMSYVLEAPCVFVTLTFAEDVLKTTSAKTRRDYVRRFCKSQSNKYVANIDYGKLNGREHYHAVIQTRKVNFADYFYGNIDAEKIIASYDTDLKRISRYISKLSLHALKKSTKNCRVIYSR